MDVEKIEEKIRQIKLLMQELEQIGPDPYKVQKLGTLLNYIGTQKELYVKHRNLFDAATEILIRASLDADACKCDPTQRRPCE
ncbi:MAG: hypothetical protein LUQ65_11360 [Candidatus Helarchaeota archaeon]|nr:hypothetical protein [Candidatus Helarchaeota archaeon]